MTTQFVDTPKNTTGNVELLKFIEVLKEDLSRQDNVITENTTDSALTNREKFAIALTQYPKLSSGQKEQALHFLFHPAYTKDGYAIALQYLKLCLNPRYTARGTAWKAR
jgi:hypothetical protein